jgi:hypothetical protein
MKKLLTISTIILLFFVGCSNQENNLTSPINSDHEQLGKIKLTSTLSNTLGLAESNIVSTTQIINGALGGLLSFEQDAVNSEGKLVHVYAQFQISPGAFIGSQTITMTADVNNGCVYFYPHMVFNQTCFLDYGLSNVNLYNLGFLPSDTKADFVFFDDSGAIELIQNNGITLNFSKGIIKVNAAKIDHFSRYGFLR